MMPVHPKPKPDESISMYLLRVSEYNGYENPSGLFRLARLPDGRRMMHKVLTETDHLPALANTIGRPVVEMQNLVYPPEKTVKLPTYAEYCGRRLPLLALRLENACLCPECLQEDNYGRQEWDWALFASCRRHGKLLLDTCPECSKPTSRYRMGVSHCVCGFDFRTAESQAVDTNAVDFVHSILDGNHIYGDPETVLRLLILLAGISALCDQLELDLGRLWATPMAKLHEGLTDACEAIKAGNLGGLARKVAMRRLALWPDLGPRGALLPFLMYKDGLGRLWNPLVMHEVGTRLYPTVASHPVPAEGVKLSLEGAAALLGLSGRVVKESARHGALTAIRGPKVDGFGHWVFDTVDVSGLLQALRCQVPPDDSTAYDLREVMPRVAPGANSWGHVLGMIRAGELRVVAFNELEGAVSLRFQGLATPTLELDTDQLSIKDCAKDLGIYTDAIYRVIKVGLLPHTRTGCRYVVQCVDLKAFTRDYVFIKELAGRLQVNPTNLAEKLMHAGVYPVSGPRVDKGLVYLFRREDVAKVNLKEVAENPFYSTRTGRKSDRDKCRASKSPYIKSSEAAKLLGITIQQLSIIERAGRLKPRKVKEYLPNRRLYLRGEVANYIQTFRNNPDMLTVVQAATLLGEEPEYFHRKWVRTGKLEEITDGLDNWCRRGDVEALRQEKQSLLTAKEASEVLGSEKSTIRNWTKSGRIKPVSGPAIDGSNWYCYARKDIEKLAREVRVKRECDFSCVGHKG